MGVYEYAALWCGAWAVFAVVGYGRVLAGVTRAQRTVQITGRVERVDRPRHGGSKTGGISVVVSYPDPDTGERVTVTNDGERGDAIQVAWVGRKIGVLYPRGRAHAYRFTEYVEDGKGLGWPTFGVFLVYAGLVTAVAVDRGWPWALVGGCGPIALWAAWHLPGTLRRVRERRARIAAMESAPGKVVAVLRDVSTDGEGGTSTTITPVLVFTTGAGQEVTAFCDAGAEKAYGREVVVHHAADDPSVFTLDRAAEHRSWRVDVTAHVVVLVVFTGAAVVGAALV